MDALVTPSSPPFFIWHTAEDIYVPPEHTYRLAAALAANDVAHAVHVFSHGPHSLGLAHGAGDVAIWTTLAASWIADQADVPARDSNQTISLDLAQTMLERRRSRAVSTPSPNASRSEDLTPPEHRDMHDVVPFAPCVHARRVDRRLGRARWNPVPVSVLAADVDDKGERY